MFNKILVPLDGSLLAEQVYPYVAEIARAFNSEIDMVGVCEPEETESGQACRLYINNEAAQLGDILGDISIKMNQTVIAGKPAEKILEYARKNRSDIIILSSHGRSGIKPWSLGSTVNKLLHTAGIPLIVIRSQEKESSPVQSDLFKQILIPLDGSSRSAVVIPLILELTRKLPTEITLMQAIEKGHQVHTIGGLNYVPYKDHDLEAKKTSVQIYLEETAAIFTGTQAKVKTAVRLGDPADEIIKCASETNATLIALASHVHSAVEAWFYGSVTHKIVQTAGRSFLLVPSEGKIK